MKSKNFAKFNSIWCIVGLIMELSFVLITFLCIINRSFVLSDTKLEDAKKRLQNEPEVTMLDVYPELNVTTSEAYYGCYSPYYNKQLIKPLERKVIDIANDFLVSRLFQYYF